MKDATIDELRGYVDQLLAHGLLQQAGDEYPILQITADGLALLKDAGAAPDLSLARQKRPDRRLPKRARVETEGWEGVDRDLFEELRVLRLRDRAPPPRAALRHLPRHDAARDRALEAEDEGRVAPRLRRGRSESRRPRRARACGGCGQTAEQPSAVILRSQPSFDDFLVSRLCSITS